MVKEVDKQDLISRILFKLDIAEAMNYAIVGSEAKGAKQFKNWRMRQINEIKKLRNRKISTIWDSIKPGKSRRL